MITTEPEGNIHSPFMSMRQAELLSYGPWEVSNSRAECDGCSCMIMAGDRMRASHTGRMCTMCGEE